MLGMYSELSMRKAKSVKLNIYITDLRSTGRFYGSGPSSSGSDPSAKTLSKQFDMYRGESTFTEPCEPLAFAILDPPKGRVPFFGDHRLMSNP